MRLSFDPDDDTLILHEARPGTISRYAFSLKRGQWSHVVAIVSEGEGDPMLYVDGVQVAPQPEE